MTFFVLIGNPATGWMVVWLIMYVVTAAASILLRDKGDSKDEKGDAAIRGNVADPKTPIPVPYGIKRWDPPQITQWLESDLNSSQPVKDSIIARLYHGGWGPIDGANFQMWLNDQQVWNIVDLDSPEQAKRLQAIDEARKIWGFPAEGISPESIVIYIDGIALYVSNGYLGGSLLKTGFKQYTEEQLEPIEFTNAHDSTISIGTVRSGSYFPAKGKIDQSNFRIGVITNNYEVPTKYTDKKQIEFSKGGYDVIKDSYIRLGTTNEGIQYFWVPFIKNNKSFNPEISNWKITAKIQNTVEIETDSDGRTRVIFYESVPVGVDVTATYKANEKKEIKGVEWDMRLGNADQEPLDTPYGGIPREISVSTDLQQAIPKRYSSSTTVDDLIIDLASPAMYELSDNGIVRGAGRFVQISFKRNSAPDTLTAGTDPSKGWVRLKFPSSKNYRLGIRGRSTGALLWRYSIADLYAYTLNKTYITGQSSLPNQDIYDIEIVALDRPGDDTRGLSYESIISTLNFDKITEITRIRMVLPYQVLILVRAPQDQDWTRLSVKFSGRIVKNLDTGEEEFSRNPTWCQTDLITHPIYGGGEFYTEDRGIVLAKAIAAAAFNDEEVTLETGEKEIRSFLDYILTDSSALGDQLDNIGSGSETLCVPEAGGFTWIIQQDEAPVMTITDADIKVSDSSLQIHGIEEHPNVLNVTYTPAPAHEEDSFLLRLGADDPDQIHTRDVSALGVSRPTQVVRFGTALLRQWNLHDHAITFVGEGYRLIQLEVGDIVDCAITRYQINERYRVMGFGLGSTLIPLIMITKHDPLAFKPRFLGANGGVIPGLREPSDKVGPTGIIRIDDRSRKNSFLGSWLARIRVTNVFGNLE